ncbi:DUF4232 domain-containing protein [Agrococcus baldri]|uniref:DUF4232 domain-containing protein n=1 Tax=Agrococcus baldri TaxID=153730 RepID=A0AA87RBF8_9MICO|nr:DUF4232 domain-containing protein [Agrococcus baldri]GEK80000.1 hypothetical protein ABA31_13510 [Agrococcus baldri]
MTIARRRNGPSPLPTVRRAVPTALACAAVLATTACLPPPDVEPRPTASAAVTVEDAAPTAAPVPHESELPAGFDSEPDTTAEPDEALGAEELTELLRVPATAAVRPDSCAADAVEAELWGYDVAAGSRFSTLRVTNVSDAPCTVAGYPGIGARGEWGSAFLILAEQDPIDSGDGSPVTLAPGAAASAPIRWTGALAGAHDEWISLLVVQLAQGQEPLRVAPTISAESMVGGDSGAPHEATMDVGMLTDVRVGSFSAV